MVSCSYTHRAIAMPAPVRLPNPQARLVKKRQSVQRRHRTTCTLRLPLKRDRRHLADILSHRRLKIVNCSLNATADATAGAHATNAGIQVAVDKAIERKSSRR